MALPSTLAAGVGVVGCDIGMGRVNGSEGGGAKTRVSGGGCPQQQKRVLTGAWNGLCLSLLWAMVSEFFAVVMDDRA